jgi:hypothetical protein
LRAAARPQVTREIRRDLQADVSFALPNGRRHFADALHLADDSKRLRVYKPLHDLAAFSGPVFVQHNGGHVFYVVVQRVAESDHFYERREEHKEEGQGIAQHYKEFLVENRVKAAEEPSHNSIVIVIEIKSSNARRRTRTKKNALICLHCCDSSVPQTHPPATAQSAVCPPA